MAGRTIFLRAEGSTLVPDDETNESLVRSLKPGKPVRLTYVQPRHGEHQKRLWKEFAEIAVILTAHGIKGYTTADDVKNFALRLTGNAQLEPVSKALARMYGGVEWAIRNDSTSYSAKDEAAIIAFHEEWKAAFFETAAPHLPDEAAQAIRDVFEWVNPMGRDAR